MRLHSAKNSTFSRRVRIALREKGLELEELETDKDARAAPEYRALNPYGRIPTLVDGELVLYETSAILEYLELCHPQPALVPSAPALRARCTMHLKLCDIEFTPHAINIQRPKRLQDESTWDREEFARCSSAIAAHYEILERQRAGKTYLVAERFTWADLAYLPFLHFHELLEVPLPPNIAAWWQRLRERESARATEPSR